MKILETEALLYISSHIQQTGTFPRYHDTNFRRITSKIRNPNPCLIFNPGSMLIRSSEKTPWVQVINSIKLEKGKLVRRIAISRFKSNQKKMKNKALKMIDQALYG